MVRSQNKQEEKGWTALWTLNRNIDARIDCERDGWLKLQSRDWCAVTYSHPDLTAYPIGHAHNDFGSVSIFYNGIPIVVDIGRKNYSESSNGVLNGTEASAHNTILIGGKSLLFAGRGYMSLKSGAGRRLATCKIIEKDKSIRWSAVTQNGHSWERVVELGDDGGVTFFDAFVMRSNEDIEGFLYLSDKFKPEQKSFSKIILYGYDMEIELSMDNVDVLNLEESSFFPHYGVCASTHRLHWVKNTNVGSDLSIKIQLKPYGNMNAKRA